MEDARMPASLACYPRMRDTPSLKMLPCSWGRPAHRAKLRQSRDSQATRPIGNTTPGLEIDIVTCSVFGS